MWGYSLELVPAWCTLPADEHQDGLGGCWSISAGLATAAECRTCEHCALPELDALWMDIGGEGGEG
jgi:hypothetical protein